MCPSGGGAHRPVLRISLENRLKIRHVLINQIFQRDDDALLRITEQIIIAHLRVKQSIREVSELCECQVLLIRELVLYETGPLDMDIRLFFETLENHTFIRILRRGRRSGCYEGKFLRFL